ncbi:cyclin B [Tritrichomonas foetus]|uniref:Cyclin B n=1 Tax=Tritrichomonas foetus TaxID=1144522 RepID=A0A1J4KVZ2_9EUKA|nr:cyclin B [Tritrichomonas foetus]|eukprot:OHT15306.1 cyclin B [Tritrichomonas foetus]
MIQDFPFSDITSSSDSFEKQRFTDLDTDTPEDDDENDGYDYFKEYVDVFFLNISFYEEEVAILRSSSYISITQSQMAALVDWMSEICDTYFLSIDTLSLSVFLLDIYLLKSLKNCPLISQLQLLAASCILIAAKYEERFFPAASEILYLCDGLYNRSDLIRMQNQVLSIVQHRITRPSDARFAARLKIANVMYTGEVEVEPLFCRSIDFVFRAALRSSFLSLSPPNKLAKALVDTARGENEEESEMDFEEKNEMMNKIKIIERGEAALKMAIHEVLEEIAKSEFENS